MNTKFFTMYRDMMANAYFVLTPQGKRLAIFYYGTCEDDVTEEQARNGALDLINIKNYAMQRRRLEAAAAKGKGDNQ